MLKKISLISCVIASVGFAGCTTMSNPVTEKNLNKLQNTTWVLTELKGVEIKSSTPMNLPAIQFDNESVSGSDGCNRFMGGYAVKAKEIKLSRLATTAMACLNATDITEKFNQSLHTTTQYDANDKELKFLDAENNVLLKFKPAQAQ